MKKLIYSLPMVLSLSAFSEDVEYHFQKLSEARKTVTLPELSKADKLLIIDQAKLVLKDIFVHRDLKIRNYGTDADPLPALDVIKNKFDKLSTVAFHQEMYRTFQKMHDWHTTYQMPKPYSCYRTILPIAFKAVRNEFGKSVVGVDSVSSKPEVINLLPAGLNLVPGEILVKYNNEPVADVLTRNEALAYGANPAAIKRDSVFSLSAVSQKTGQFPLEDEVTLTLQNKEGKLREVSVPWIVRGDQDCLKPADSATTMAKSAIGEKEIQNVFNSIVRQKKKSKFKDPGDLVDSLDPILKYKIIRNEFGTFGYLRLDSFVPLKLNDVQFVNEVKRILDGPLALTDGLIVDLRSNGGGYIWIGEAMVQLLNPRNTVPLNFVLKNSQPNRHYWKTLDPTSPFGQELARAEVERLPYTRGIPLNDAKYLNELGQSHMKPVAVFINASCYSTCDMFSASMQDLGAGIIVGEDPNTGAGGANNWNHQMMFDRLKKTDPGPFKELPGGINIGFSYRQTFRTGLHAGELIEDVGVRADMIVEATVSDLDTSEYQLRAITKRLAEDSDNFNSWVRIQESSSDIKIGKPASVFMKWENTSQVDVRVDGVVKGTIDIDYNRPEGKEVLIPFLDTTGPMSTQFELLGKENEKLVWRKVLNVRTVPETTVVSSALSVDFENGTAPFLIYNENTAPENGWRIEDGRLRVGTGSAYVPNVKSTLSLFAKLEKVSSIQFDAVIDSEADYDGILINVVVDGIRENLSFMSGKHSQSTYMLDLSKYQGKNVEIQFEFKSDGNTEGSLVAIDNILLK